MERAKKAGQAVSKNAASGTFASGVQLVREALPVVMSDLVKNAPEGQKEKISKLLDIWERGQTFPPDMLATMKQMLSGHNQSKRLTMVPMFTSNTLLPGVIGSLASQPSSNGSVQPYHPQANQQTVNVPAAVAPAQQDPSALYAAFAALAQSNAHTNTLATAQPQLPFSQSSFPPPPPGFMPPPPAQGVAHQPALPPPPAGANDMTAQILQAINAGLIAPDQALQVLNAMAQAQNGAPGAPLQPPVASQVPQIGQTGLSNGAHLDRYEQHDTRYRDRSRSPDYQHRQSPRRSPPNPNRRDSPTYGVYDPGAGPDMNSRFDRGDQGRGRGKQRGGRNDRNEYRQRSPPKRQPSPPRNSYGNSKFLDWDHSLPRDHIRVFSRTLFVGGAGGTEGEIRSIFSRFGQVQTCIVNSDKRHAFVKMLTRPDAVHAKEGMDALQDPVALSKARQV